MGIKEGIYLSRKGPFYLSAKADISALRKYLESKYLKNLHSETENFIFKTLWKFVVTIENDDTIKHRRINFNSLRIFYERRPTEINKFIESNKSFFSNVSSSGVEFLHYFLSFYPKIFEYLNDSARIPIINFANSKLKYYSRAFYLSEDKYSHLIKVMDKIVAEKEICQDDSIDQKTWCLLLSETEYKDVIFKIGILHYCRSDQFTTTSIYFKRFIMPIINELNENQLKDLIEGINTNVSIYGRYYIETFHKHIKQRYLDLNCSFIDAELHSNYLKSIPSDATVSDIETLNNDTEDLPF